MTSASAGFLDLLALLGRPLGLVTVPLCWGGVLPFMGSASCSVSTEACFPERIVRLLKQWHTYEEEKLLNVRSTKKAMRFYDNVMTVSACMTSHAML